jgi:ribosomal protein S18 acetylase RimI-like enzyme
MGDIPMAKTQTPLKQVQPVFRFAELADTGSIVTLINSAYRGDSSRAGWTTEADLLDGQRTDREEVRLLVEQEGSLILLALLGDELIGTVHVQRDGRAAQIGMLVIRPGMQGMGLGRQLLQAAEQIAIKKWQVKSLQMHVISLRHELIAFYRRQGYRQTGNFKPFPQDVRYGIPKVPDLQLELLEKMPEL